MIKTNRNLVAATLLAVFSVIGLSACDSDDSALEKAAKKIDNSAQDAGDKIEEAAKDTSRAIEDATD